MTAHKHAKLIKAKADNMELVKFIKVNGEWIVDNLGSCHFDDMCEYFLCLPKHKDACLHWLNGGKSQLEYTHSSYPTWNDIDNDATDWSTGHVFMDESLKMRIKPRKEKRWILINKALNRVCNELYDYQPKNQNGWVSHEIEVEV